MDFLIISEEYKFETADIYTEFINEVYKKRLEMK